MKSLQWIVVLAAAGVALALSLLTQGCGSPAAKSREVVIYTALDRQFSEPILRAFEERTGISVRAVYDAEAVKTVGLVNRLIAERERPQADLFWNNEVVRSIQLRREGLTEPYDSPSAEAIPAAQKDSDGHWVGFAARARVFLVNTDLLPDEADHPSRVEDLLDPEWKGRFAFAKPLFGTTSTHAALIRSMLPGEDEAFWQGVIDNGVMLAGNAQCRDAVADGELAWCWTDTDDAHGALLDGKPVRMIYPTAVPGHDGVFLIPNSLVRIKGGPNPAEAQELIDYLLSEEVEAALALERGAQIPLRARVPGPPALEPLDPSRVLAVDWDAVADELAESAAALDKLLGPKGAK